MSSVNYANEHQPFVDICSSLKSFGFASINLAPGDKFSAFLEMLLIFCFKFSPPKIKSIRSSTAKVPFEIAPRYPNISAPWLRSKKPKNFVTVGTFMFSKRKKSCLTRRPWKPKLNWGATSNCNNAWRPEVENVGTNADFLVPFNMMMRKLEKCIRLEYYNSSYLGVADIGLRDVFYVRDRSQKTSHFSGGPKFAFFLVILLL